MTTARPRGDCGLGKCSSRAVVRPGPRSLSRGEASTASGSGVCANFEPARRMLGGGGCRWRRSRLRSPQVRAQVRARTSERSLGLERSLGGFPRGGHRFGHRFGRVRRSVPSAVAYVGAFPRAGSRAYVGAFPRGSLGRSLGPRSLGARLAARGPRAPSFRTGSVLVGWTAPAPGPGPRLRPERVAHELPAGASGRGLGLRRRRLTNSTPIENAIAK